MLLCDFISQQMVIKGFTLVIPNIREKYGCVVVPSHQVCRKGQRVSC